MSKPRFNIVDAVVILVLIAAIAAAVWFFAQGDAGDEVYVYFVVEFLEQMPDFEENIIAGHAPNAEIRDAIRNYFLGHAWDINVLPAMVTIFDNSTNSFVRTQIPNRYDIYLTVRGQGTENQSTIQSNGVAVRVGQEMFLRGHGYAGRGFITQIWTTERGQ